MFINVNSVWICKFLVFCDLLTSDFWSTVSHTTASTSSGSSDTGMSPSSASPTQNTVAVECRWCHALVPPPAPCPAPPLPSQHPAASTETHWHTDGPEQAANSTRLPTASTSPLIPIGHSHLLHFVNWSCLLSLAVAPGNRLHVRVECNLWNQSLRFIHPERIRRHFFTSLSTNAEQKPPLTASAQQGLNLDAVVNQLDVPLSEHGKNIVSDP